MQKCATIDVVSMPEVHGCFPTGGEQEKNRVEAKSELGYWDARKDLANVLSLPARA